MGEKARLRAALDEVRGQRDQAFAARDRAIGEAARINAELARERNRPTVVGRVRAWLEELGQALGVGW